MCTMKATVQTQFKNDYQAGYVARNIAQSLNRGSAIQDKINTVLNQLREAQDIKSLKALDQNAIQNYISYLQEQVRDGDLTTKTTATYISALNDIISYVNENLNKDLQTVSAKEFGLSRGEREPINRAINIETHQAFINFLLEKNDIQAQALVPSVSLQREFGLRLRESEAIKAETIEKALEKGKLELGRADGTKNSKERTIPILKETQIQALKSALDFMRQHDLKSLIPSEKLLQQYNYAEKVKQEFNQLNTDAKMDYHGERYHYAQERYFKDHASLKQISEELGHHREEITKIYLNIK